VKELLKNIPPEKRWKITANILTNINVMRAVRVRYLLATEESVIAPIMAWEKYEEITPRYLQKAVRKCFHGLKKCSTYQ
jgi:hypothetical protein